MKKASLCAFAALALIGYGCGKPGFSSSKNATIVTAKDTPVITMPLMANLNDSFSYAAGMNIATSMKDQGISVINSALVKQAIDSVFSNGKLFLTQEQAGMTLQQQLQAYAEKKIAAEKAKSATFFDENKKRPGVLSGPDGLQYEVLKAGQPNGLKPKPEDTVVVHYVGSLTNGVEFDNSVKRGEPATFPLNGVIRGWTEILQLMPEGSKWKVYIPSELGYGERGAGSAIPANSILVFDIELLDIKPAKKAASK